MAGVGQHQHAALSFLDGGQLARFQQQRAQGGVGPMHRLGGTPGHTRWQHGTQTGPQGHQVQPGEVVAVVLRQVLQAAQFVAHRVVSSVAWGVTAAGLRQLSTVQP